MDTKTIDECKELSFSGKMAFPEVVKKLLDIGVERYTVDLVKCENTYYGDNNEVYELKFTLENKECSKDFSEACVREAIREIQQQKITYLEFLKYIMEAGTVAYNAFLKGKQVHYFGRQGEIWIDNFLTKS